MRNHGTAQVRPLFADRSAGLPPVPPALLAAACRSASMAAQLMLRSPCAHSMLRFSRPSVGP